MKNQFSLFLALRYLKPKRTFLSIITLISILGVTLGIAVLIIVISVMTGFDRELREKVLGFEANVLVSSEENVVRDWRPLSEKIAKAPGVIATAPFVMVPTVAEFNHRFSTPYIRGISIEEEEKVTEIRKFVQDGELDLEGEKAIIGDELAKQLGITVGEKLVVYSLGNVRRVVDELNRADSKDDNAKSIAEMKETVLPVELTVTGIFHSGRFEYDSQFILVPLFLAQEMSLLEDNVNGITVKTADAFEGARRVQVELRKILTEPLTVLTAEDRNAERFGAIYMERIMMFFILLFISIVAAFCVMNTLITITVMKTREIGILKALGAQTGQVVWVFLAQGMVVGFIGAGAGLALGMTAVHFRNQFKNWLSNQLNIQLFPPSIYEFIEIPAQIVPRDVALICITAFFFCSLAALIPAWFAARLDPVKALRYE